MTLVASVLVYSLTFLPQDYPSETKLLASPFNSPAAERLQSLRKGGRLQRGDRVEANASFLS